MFISHIPISAGGLRALERIGSSLIKKDPQEKYVIVRSGFEEKISKNCVIPVGQTQVWVKPLRSSKQWSNHEIFDNDICRNYRELWEEHIGFSQLESGLSPKNFVVDHIHNGIRAHDRGYEYIRLGLILPSQNSSFGSGIERRFIEASKHEASKSYYRPTVSENDIKELGVFEICKLAGIRYLEDYVNGNEEFKEEDQHKMIRAALTGEWKKEWVDLLKDSKTWNKP